MIKITLVPERDAECPHCGTHVAGQRGMATHLRANKRCKRLREVKVQIAKEHGGLHYTDALARLFEELRIPSQHSPANLTNVRYYPFWVFECAWRGGFMNPGLHHVTWGGEKHYLDTEQLAGQKEAKKRCRKLIVEGNNSWRKAKAFTTLYIIRRTELARRYQRGVGDLEVGIEVILENHEL